MRLLLRLGSLAGRNDAIDAPLFLIDLGTGAFGELTRKLNQIGTHAFIILIASAKFTYSLGERCTSRTPGTRRRP